MSTVTISVTFVEYLLDLTGRLAHCRQARRPEFSVINSRSGLAYGIKVTASTCQARLSATGASVEIANVAVLCHPHLPRIHQASK